MKARRNGFSAQFAAAIEKLVREEGEDDGDDEAVQVAGAKWWTISGVQVANKVAQASKRSNVLALQTKTRNMY